MTRRVMAAAVFAVLSLFALSSCTRDLDVYFTNDTDQQLSIAYVGPDGSWNDKGPLPPHRTTALGLFGSGCGRAHQGEQFVAAGAGHNIVKRFDEICWHGTYSIP
jgi:hypothetical protein